MHMVDYNDPPEVLGMKSEFKVLKLGRVGYQRGVVISTVHLYEFSSSVFNWVLVL